MKRKLQIGSSPHLDQAELNGKEKSACLETQISDPKLNPRLHLGKIEKI